MSQSILHNTTASIASRAMTATTPALPTISTYIKDSVREMAAHPGLTSSLFSKAKTITQWLIYGTGLPPYLHNQACVVLAFASGISVAGGLSHIFYCHRSNRAKIQLAVFHLVRMLNVLPDVEERLRDDPQGLIEEIDHEVTRMVGTHLTTYQAADVKKQLKRKILVEVKKLRTADAKRQRTDAPVNNEHEVSAGQGAGASRAHEGFRVPSPSSSERDIQEQLSAEEEQADVSMADADDDNAAPQDENAVNPSSSPPGIASSPTPAARRPLQPRAVRPRNDIALHRPPAANDVLARKQKTSLKKLTKIPGMRATYLEPHQEGASPHVSPASGTTEYRVAESHKYYKDVVASRQNRREFRNLLEPGPSRLREEIVDEGEIEGDEVEEENEDEDGDGESDLENDEEEQPVEEGIEDVTGDQEHSRSNLTSSEDEEVGELSGEVSVASRVSSSHRTPPGQPRMSEGTPAFTPITPSLPPTGENSSPLSEAESTLSTPRPAVRAGNRQPTPGVRKSARKNLYRGSYRG